MGKYDRTQEQDMEIVAGSSSGSKIWRKNAADRIGMGMDQRSDGADHRGDESIPFCDAAGAFSVKLTEEDIAFLKNHICLTES